MGVARKNLWCALRALTSGTPLYNFLNPPLDLPKDTRGMVWGSPTVVGHYRTYIKPLFCLLFSQVRHGARARYDSVAPGRGTLELVRTHARA